MKLFLLLVCCINKSVEKIAESYNKICLMIFMMIFSNSVLAETLGETARRWVSSLQGLGELLAVGFSLCGFGAMGFGIWKLLTARKRQEPYSDGLLWAVGGSVLMSLVFFSGVLSESSFGTNAASSGLDKLGIN